MKLLILLISLLPTYAFAVGPIYQHKDPAVHREFQNIYQELKTKFIVESKTIAQINLFAPSSVGQLFYCSNCTSTAVCVSTGTGIGAFSSLSSKTTHCN